MTKFGLIIFTSIPIIILVLNTIALYRLYITNNEEKGLVIFCFATTVVVCVLFLVLLYKLQSN